MKVDLLSSGSRVRDLIASILKECHKIVPVGNNKILMLWNKDYRGYTVHKVDYIFST